MKEDTSRKISRLIIMVATLILIVLVVVVSLLTGDRVVVQPGEKERETGTTILAGGDRDDPSFREEMTEDPVVSTTVSPEDRGDPMAQEKELPEEGAGAQVDLEKEPPKEQDPQNDPEQESESNTSQPAVTTLGIDVSKWQGKIDWQQVAEAGVDFAIIRVGFRTTDTGEIKEDPYAAYNLQQAAEAGIQLGAYFFSTAVTVEEAREEARWTAEFLAGYPITYPVAYNCEGFLSSDSRMYGTDAMQRTDHALAFLRVMEQEGYEAIFHASKSDLTDGVSWDTARIEERYPVWVAQYPSVPYPKTARATYYGQHTMWQYTSQGTVPGIHAHVDVNVAYFAYEKTAEPKDSQKANDKETVDVPIDSSFSDTDEMVTAKEVTNLRTEPSSIAPETVVAQLTRGQWARRTGSSTKGWSRLEYEGQTLYAVTSLLLTEDEYYREEHTTEPSTESEAPTETTVTYEAVSDRVTAKEKTNLRNAPGTDGTQVVATITHGEWVERTGIGSNGWSRLNYQGQTVYALTSYLTTDEDYDPGDVADRDTVWTDRSESMTAKEKTNLRDKPTTEGSQVIATIVHGEVVHRTAVGSNGWSRVVYNGQVLYAVSSYLTEVD